MTTQEEETKSDSLPQRFTMHNKYVHEPRCLDITCKYVVKSKKASSCPIYTSMKKNYQYTADNLFHLERFNHFHDEYVEKEKCRHGVRCKAWIRFESGKEYRLDDQCHIKLFRHPPRRNRQIVMEQNWNKFLFNDYQWENYPVYEPSNKDWKQYDNAKDGFLKQLIDEVVRNGFSSDLALTESDHKHKKWSLLKIVDDKLNHIRHQQIGKPLKRDEMLALVLYTGCDCNYDLCKSQRNGNYKKWLWFDYCLFWALRKLRNFEVGSYKIYTGLNNVKLDKKRVSSAFFPTYTSTSWEKIVALDFMENQGMLVEINGKYRESIYVICCDVSWISKFPDECEVLIARSGKASCNNFVLSVKDQSSGIQTVSLDGVY